MKVTKVFTKYDHPPQRVLIPFFKDLTPMDIDASSGMAPTVMDYRELLPINKENGTENVLFVTYGDKI